jgi:hypothetical protein
MRVGDVVIHPKYGKGNVVKIFWDKDQVICFLANENRYFTKAGAEFMIQAASDPRATMGADFDHGTAPTKATAKTHTCSFCQRSFGKERGMQVHEAQCIRNPKGHTWARSCGKVKKKRGAQPGNQSARRYKPVIKLPLDVLVAEHNEPLLESETVNSTPPGDYLKFDEPTVTGATPQATQVKQPTYLINGIYIWLLVLILLAVLLCVVVYAALGVKLLLTN